MTVAHVTVFPDAEALASHAAGWVAEMAASSDGPFTINLSGGSTPKRLYELLAAAPLRDKMPWDRVHLFFGDERFVPRDNKDSNYRMVDQALTVHVPIPAENVHGIPVDGTPEDAASRYEATLKSFYGADTLDPARPLFDVTLLGLGEDGHTASLFPGVAMLKETRKWVGAVIGAKPEPRLTLTYPVLASSRVAMFLVAGAAKTAILERLLVNDPALPSSHIAPVGELRVWADRAAAGTSNE